MALALRGTAASGGNSVNTSISSQAITLPTGTVAYDLVYFLVSVGAVVSAPSITVGAGDWTLVLTTDATGATSTILGYKTVGDSEAAPTVSWTTAGKVAWTAIGFSPAAGVQAVHSGFATVTNSGAAATTHTPGSFAAGAATGASVLFSGPRTSAAANATAVTNTVVTWTEPTGGDQSTASGNVRQSGAWTAYRLAQTGTITPGAVTHSLSSFAPTHHAFAIEAAIPPPVGKTFVFTQAAVTRAATY